MKGMEENTLHTSTIDFVIPWVDGNDPEWVEKRNKYQVRRGDNLHPARYRDWGLLLYLFRGIEAFAPWVRNIYFITDHQAPSWLNTVHPKLRVTSLEEFMSPEYLPTFNSMAIELNLHHIAGLSETFVYLNDDMFFLSPVKGSQFFRNGLPRDSAVLSPVIIRKHMDLSRVVVNSIGIINQYFRKNDVIMQKPANWLNLRYGKQLLQTICLIPWRHFPGFYNDHLPQPFLKETFRKVWNTEGEILHEICCHRFRNYYEDTCNWLMRYWQLCENRFQPIGTCRGKNFDMTQLPEVLRAIRKRQWPMICVNDSESIEDIKETREQLAAAFEEILPCKSAFER